MAEFEILDEVRKDVKKMAVKGLWETGSSGKLAVGGPAPPNCLGPRKIGIRP